MNNYNCIHVHNGRQIMVIKFYEFDVIIWILHKVWRVIIIIQFLWILSFSHYTNIWYPHKLHCYMYQAFPLFDFFFCFVTCHIEFCFYFRDSFPKRRVPRQFSNFTYKIKRQWICHTPSAQALNTNLSRTVLLCKLNFHDHDLIKIQKSLKLTLKDNLCAIQRRNCRLCNRSSDGSSAQGADHFFEFFPYVYVLVWRVINVPFMTPQIPLTVCYLTMLFNVSVKNRLLILHFNHLI